MRLKGDSSWRDAVDHRRRQRQDAVRRGVRPARQHRDIPRRRQDRLRHAPRRLQLPARSHRQHLDEIGSASPRCARPARGSRSTAAYYGLFVVEEKMGHRIISEFFPGQRRRRSLQGRTDRRRPIRAIPTGDRLSTFWNAMTPAALAAVVDLPTSFLTWAGEMHAQRRRRLLGRRPQLLSLRPGGEGIRVPAQRPRLDPRLLARTFTATRSGGGQRAGAFNSSGGTTSR